MLLQRFLGALGAMNDYVARVYLFLYDMGQQSTE